MPKKPCCQCGRLLVVNTNSRPEPTCHPCRRGARPPVVRASKATKRTTCAFCSGPLPEQPHQGNPRRWCNRSCADRARRQTANPAIRFRTSSRQPPQPRPTCAVCGRKMCRNATSRPQGQSTCHGCRRRARAMRQPRHPCERCGTITTNRRFCSRPCSWQVRQQQHGDTSSGWHRKRFDAAAAQRKREYNSTAYKRARAAAKREVDAGRAHCWRCGTWLPPRSEFHLGHDDDDRSIIRGAECPSCNLKAAASTGAKVANARRNAQQPTPHGTSSQPRQPRTPHGW
jgi:hypothetical protein